MKKLLTFLLFYMLTVQVMVCQSPVECGDDPIVIIYESQSSSINLQDCEKDLLITTIGSNLEITASIQVNENYTAHIIPTEMYKINMKPGYFQKTSPAKTKEATDSDDGDGKDDFIIYPNPVDTVLTIQTHVTILVSYTISNVYGVLQLQGNTQTNSTIDTTSLLTGLYYINIQTTTETITKSFYKL